MVQQPRVDKVLFGVERLVVRVSRWERWADQMLVEKAALQGGFDELNPGEEVSTVQVTAVWGRWEGDTNLRRWEFATEVCSGKEYGRG